MSPRHIAELQWTPLGGTTLSIRLIYRKATASDA